MRLLAAHDRSELEIRTRLQDAGTSASTITRTIRRLRQLRYLDEHRFAQTTADQAARRGYGSEYVRARLTKAGIADDLVDVVVEATFADEEQLARAALQRRSGAEPRSLRERARAARFLARRGFSESVVFAIVGEDC